jgi:uncharacterized protein (DUF2147 family)
MSKLVISIFCFFFTYSIVSAQSPVGIWKNVDDEDGREKSHIEVYEKSGKLYGKVIKLLPAATITKCDACSGDKKGKSIVGMDILWDLVKSGKVWDDGEILDPKNGKVYSAKVELDGKDKLKVRGYMGVSILGRTQTWYRVK